MTVATIDRKRLYYIGNLFIFMIGPGFAVRAAITALGIPWEVNMVVLLIPALVLAAMGLMGSAGGMSIQFVLPQMGSIFDAAKAEAAGGADKLASLSPGALDEAIRYASVESFQAVAYVPLLLLPVFGAIWLYDRKSGGHRTQTMGGEA
jgi:hypothetical protein